MRRPFRLTALVTGCLAGAIVAGTGCALNPLNGFLDPTKVGTFPVEFREGGIRRVLTPRESPMGIAGATEPTPADLVPEYVNYRLGPQDQVQITIDDFITQGIPLSIQLEVDPSGFIRVPQLGPIKVTGMTEAELEGDLRNRVIQGKFLTDPIVTVSIAVRRQLTFSILGSVRSAGTYPIAFSDFRVLDAIGFAGDIGAGVRKLYVIRRGPGGTAPAPSAMDQAQPPATEPGKPGEKEYVIPPPDAPISPTMLSAYSTAGQETRPAATAAQTTRPAATDDRKALEDIMAEQSPTSRPATRTQPAATTQDRPFAPLIFDPVTGEVKEAPARQPESEEVAPQSPVPSPDGEARRPFRWDDDSGDELAQRVIEIDVEALRAGDPRQNIVIRNRDTVVIPIDTGVFYVFGEVTRPGVFAFNEREITLKRAMAIVGGFSPLAWPQRCEIIRREKGTDKQITVSVNLDAIFANLEDDVLLKDDDIVNVGSNIVAPFLFVIRNSFRFTYGFGFVYDRNFADRDAYGGRTNPEVIEQARRANRGLPF